jgi:prephenate dehydrogenase
MAVATVIGGAGRMGAWFANFLKGAGYQVVISDTNGQLAEELARKQGYLYFGNPILAIQPAQLVILATPTLVTENVLRQINPYLPNRSLLVEISSVKAPVRRTLERMKRRGVAILSIHPMFGPGVRNLDV